MTTARIQAILAREAATAVIFRRGPTNKTAVIGWADWDAPRKRIVFAEGGLICSLSLLEDRTRKVLFDCNTLKCERRLAPY